MRSNDVLHGHKIIVFLVFHSSSPRLSARRTGIVRSYQQGGELYRHAFQGADFIDHLVGTGYVYSREEAVALGRNLLENDLIRHGTQLH